MKDINAYEYSISIRFGEFEGEQCYEATIKELPSIAEYADTYSEAYELTIDAIETLSELYAEQGKLFPAPIKNTSQDYSGRITLRLPKSLHCSIAQIADTEDTSLNSLISSVLSAFVGFGTGLTKTTENWHNLENTRRNSSSNMPEVISIHEYKQAANG